MEISFVYDNDAGAQLMRSIDEGKPQSACDVARLVAAAATRTAGAKPWAVTVTVDGVTKEWSPPLRMKEKLLSLDDFRGGARHITYKEFVKEMGGTPADVSPQRIRKLLMMPSSLWAWQDEEHVWRSPQLEDAGCSFCNSNGSGYRSEDGVIAALYVEYLRRY